MAGRHEMSSSVTATGHDLSCTDTQDSAVRQNSQLTNGHIDFSFRKRLEKIDWRKIGLFAQHCRFVTCTNSVLCMKSFSLLDAHID